MHFRISLLNQTLLLRLSTSMSRKFNENISLARLSFVSKARFEWNSTLELFGKYQADGKENKRDRFP
jgi:hypothetical protein